LKLSAINCNQTEFPYRAQAHHRRRLKTPLKVEFAYTDLPVQRVQSGCTGLQPASSTQQETAMPQFAKITGDVTYTPGDGAPIEIPRDTRIEVALEPDSATLSWDAGDGVAAVTAIPRIQFDDYVKEGQITMTPQ
jgi:hypothetical protein